MSRRPFKLTPARATPEADLQRTVVRHLRAYLPEAVWWTASLSGVTLTAHVAREAKKAGMQKGAPDLSFVWPDGRTSYIELKSSTGDLTPEQRALLSRLGPRGLMEVCRTLTDVKGVLGDWLVEFDLRWLTDAESVKLRKAA